MNATVIVEALFWIAWILALVLGFIYWKWPDEVIEAQRRFYSCINWRMEPIDLRREERNTKAMGILIGLVDVLALVLRWRWG